MREEVDSLLHQSNRKETDELFLVASRRKAKPFLLETGY